MGYSSGCTGKEKEVRQCIHSFIPSLRKPAKKVKDDFESIAELEADVEVQRDRIAGAGIVGHGVGVDLQPAVPPLHQEGGQPAPHHAPEEEKVQEQNHLGLQNPGHRNHQHVSGKFQGEVSFY